VYHTFDSTSLKILSGIQPRIYTVIYVNSPCHQRGFVLESMHCRTVFPLEIPFVGKLLRFGIQDRYHGELLLSSCVRCWKVSKRYILQTGHAVDLLRPSHTQEQVF
jgi:hypothetical protein